MLSLLTGWLLGVLLGMRHALEPDHLAAVSTMVTERPEARTTSGAALLGAAWGLGHTLALLVAGALLLLLRRSMPDGLADFFELVVAVMLLFLGARALRTAVTTMQKGEAKAHLHGLRLAPRRPLDKAQARRLERFRSVEEAEAVAHSHAHVHAAGAAAHVHLGRLTLARRPLVIGLLHGLAGSGALTALVLASMPSTLSAIVYMLLFGVGSLFGMALLTGVVGLSLRRAAASRRTQALVVAVAGSASVVLGITAGIPLALRLLGR